MSFKEIIIIVRFTKFVASIFRDFIKSTGQNVTKHTSFERSFNLASEDAIPAEKNSLLPEFSAEMTFPHVKIRVVFSRMEEAKFMLGGSTVKG